MSNENEETKTADELGTPSHRMMHSPVRLARVRVERPCAFRGVHYVEGVFDATPEERKELGESVSDVKE